MKTYCTVAVAIFAAVAIGSVYADLNVYTSCSAYSTTPHRYNTAVCTIPSTASNGSLCESYKLTPISYESYLLESGMYMPDVCGVVEVVRGVHDIDIHTAVIALGNVTDWSGVFTVSKDAYGSFLMCESSHGCCSSFGQTTTFATYTYDQFSTSGDSFSSSDNAFERPGEAKQTAKSGGGNGGGVKLSPETMARLSAKMAAAAEAGLNNADTNTNININANANANTAESATHAQEAKALLDQLISGDPEFRGFQATCHTPTGARLTYRGGNDVALINILDPHVLDFTMMVDPTRPYHAWSFGPCEHRDSAYASVCVKEASSESSVSTKTDVEEVLASIPTAVVRLGNNNEIVDVALIA